MNFTVAPCTRGRGIEGWTEWPAPAKLNLFLHIVGRRADGYHLLQTVFQLLDWGDTVRLRPRSDGVIGRVDPLPGLAPQSDLAMRAANALQAACGTRGGVDIAIEKRIPIGAGLGGGSSDAATVLVALNAMWETGLDENQLAELGLALGADVPLFVRGRSAWAEGIGDRLTAIDLPQDWYVIIDPGVCVPTAELFRVPDLTREAAHLTIPRFISGAATVNVFEPVVRARFEVVARALDWLNEYAPARMSGSGGCVFGRVGSRRSGEEIVRDCPHGMRGFVARATSRSALFARLHEWNGLAQDGRG